MITQKRKKIVVLLFSLIAAVCFTLLTHQFIVLEDITVWGCLILVYFISAIFVFDYGLPIIKGGGSPKNWCGMLFGLDAIIMIFLLFLCCFMKTYEVIKIIMVIIDIISDVLLIVLGVVLINLEKKE